MFKSLAESAGFKKSYKNKDIPSVTYYSLPKAGDFPVAEKVANQCLSLPMSPYLSESDIIKVVEAISSNCIFWVAIYICIKLLYEYKAIKHIFYYVRKN